MNRSGSHGVSKFVLVGAMACAGWAASRSAMASGSASATSEAGGRRVEVTSDDGSASAGTENGKVQVATASAKITIEPERILLDGQELAKLNADAKKIEVKVAGGHLTITADGAQVAAKALGK